jgi:uncharacterized membrane protein (DUF485 family)
MNWIKVLLTGLLAWLAPFTFSAVIFPNLPLGFKFLLYLLAACFGFVNYANNAMSGYLHKRNKITVSVGIAVGITWFLISFVLSAFYYVTYKGENLLEFSINLGSIYLMYPILGTLLGICEEKRGRRR